MRSRWGRTPTMATRTMMSSRCRWTRRSTTASGWCRRAPTIAVACPRRNSQRSVTRVRCPRRRASGAMEWAPGRRSPKWTWPLLRRGPRLWPFSRLNPVPVLHGRSFHRRLPPRRSGRCLPSHRRRHRASRRRPVVQPPVGLRPAQHRSPRSHADRPRVHGLSALRPAQPRFQRAALVRSASLHRRLGSNLAPARSARALQLGMRCLGMRCLGMRCLGMRCLGMRCPRMRGRSLGHRHSMLRVLLPLGAWTRRLLSRSISAPRRASARAPGGGSLPRERQPRWPWSALRMA